MWPLAWFNHLRTSFRGRLAAMTSGRAEAECSRPLFASRLRSLRLHNIMLMMMMMMILNTLARRNKPVMRLSGRLPVRLPVHRRPSEFHASEGKTDAGINIAASWSGRTQVSRGGRAG